MIKKFVLKGNGNLTQAEDLFHDVIVVFMMKIRRGELPQLTQAEPYIFTMAKNLWLTNVKKDKKIQWLQSDLIEDEIASSEDKSASTENLYDILMNAMSQMGEVCRELLKMTYFENLNLQVAAEKLKLSSADVAKTYHYRCKKKLMEELKNNKAVMALMSYE